jgi:acetate---CoA ligase (ADP-forming)
MAAPLEAMLEARSVALVGASPRPGTFGQRMVEEVTRSPARPQVHLVNPKYPEIGGRPCHPSLADLPEPVDLVLLGVRDDALEDQLALAAGRGDRSAVIFGNAHEEPGPGAPGRPLRDRLAALARDAGMQLCGAGCMGFVNVSRGLRAIGYTEASPLRPGPVALVTHSGSVFSALLRARRGLSYSLAVSSGQELVTTTPAYLEYALDLPETRVLALVLEAMRDAGRLRGVLATAADRDIPVVLLTVGGSAAGQAMVAAHSGALAAGDGPWEALARAHGVHRVGDLAELADTVELFAIGRRPVAAPVRPAAAPGAGSTGPDLARPGIATVHDSGLERAHTADLAEELGVRFTPLSPATSELLTRLLDPGLLPANPLDVWGTGADTRELFATSLVALASDPGVTAVALAVDLVEELDGDRSYPLAVRDAAMRTDKPLVVLSNLAAGIDPAQASQLRAQGIPVLEGTRTGLLALRHLLDRAGRRAGLEPAGSPRRGAARPPVDPGRQRRGRELLASGRASGAPLLALLAEYGIAVARAAPASDAPGALAAAEAVGYPVVLKTDEPAITHKSDVGGVLLGITGPDALAAGYADLAARLGARVLVGQAVPPGPELSLGLARDPGLGPLIVVGAGGVLVELLADRAVALPPVDAAQAGDLLAGLRARRLLDGVRGRPPAALAPVIDAITGLSQLAAELGEDLDALDVNPLICGPDAAVAVDALAIPRPGRGLAARSERSGRAARAFRVSGTSSSGAAAPTWPRGVAGVCAGAYAGTATIPAAIAITGSDGRYQIGSLPAGRYSVEFTKGCGVTSYATQWYSGAASRSAATPVAVAPGSIASGIDATS